MGGYAIVPCEAMAKFIMAEIDAKNQDQCIASHRTVFASRD